MHKNFWVSMAIGLYIINLVTLMTLIAYVKADRDATKIRSEQLVDSLLTIQSTVKSNSTLLKHLEELSAQRRR